MLHADKVNEIWPVLFRAIENMGETFGERFKTLGEMVDFIVTEVMKVGAWSREEVLEAWLYYQVQVHAISAGVRNHPRSN